MEQKDPKDMTASELVRWVENYTDIMCRACREMGFGCDDAEVCDCEKALEFIADKIDAELAQARELSLLRGAELWAKANGWPDFRDGEDFGAWLDRCALPRPRFEDGEPVQFEDDTVELHGVEKFIFLLSCGGSCQMQDADGNICNVFHGERVKRPAPEALGADGKPIVDGETVRLAVEYSMFADSSGCEDGNEYSLQGIESQETMTVENAHFEVRGRDYVRLVSCSAWCPAKWLTHTPPDTQERIDRDAALPAREYYARHIGHDVAEKGAVEVHAAVTAHLLKRQREIDAKGAI